jgi:hypothetical protein
LHQLLLQTLPPEPLLIARRLAVAATTELGPAQQGPARAVLPGAALRQSLGGNEHKHKRQRYYLTELEKLNHDHSDTARE